MESAKTPSTINELHAFCWENHIVPENSKVNIGYKDRTSNFTYIIRNKQGKFEIYKNNLFGISKLVYSGDESYACKMIQELILKNAKPEKEKTLTKSRKHLKAAVGIALFAFSFLFAMDKIIDHQYDKKYQYSYSAEAVTPEPQIGYYLYSGKLFFKDIFNWHEFNRKDGLWYLEENVEDELKNNFSNYQTYKENLIGKDNFTPFDWSSRPKGDSYDDSDPLDFLYQNIVTDMVQDIITENG